MKPGEVVLTDEDLRDQAIENAEDEREEEQIISQAQSLMSLN